MKHNFSKKPIQLLLFQVAAPVEQAIVDELRTTQRIHITQVETLQGLFTAFATKPWDVLIATYPTEPEVFAHLHALEPPLPFILLCELAHVNAAFALTDPVIRDVLPVTQLQRLPFVIQRELQLQTLIAEADSAPTMADDTLAATSLQRGEQRFRTIIEGFTDIMLMSDRYGILRYANAALHRVLGHHTSDLLGRPLSTFLHPAEVAITLERLRELVHHVGTTMTLEHRLQRADQGWESVETTGQSFTDPSGQPMLILHIRSLAEQKAVESALRKSEERFSLLVQSIEDYAIFLLDSTGCVASWNAGAERQKGYRYDEIIGKPYTQFFTAADQAAGKPQHLLATAQSQGHIEDEGWRVQKDGTHFWCNSVITALRNEAGALYGFAKITRDLTQQKHDAEHIRKLNRTLAVLSDTNQAIVRLRELPILFHTICHIAVDKGGLALAWIGLINPATEQLTVVAQAGVNATYLRLLPLLSQVDHAHHPLADALRAGHHVVCNDLASDPRFAPWRATTLPFGYCALAIFPLLIGQQLCGLLTLYSDEANYFDQDELQLLDEMALDVAFAMQVAEQEKQRARAEEALQESEERYRRIVEDQTELICRLDQDFRLTFVNRAYCMLHARAPEALLGVKVLDLLAPAERANLAAHLQTLTATNPSATLEQWQVMPDQSRHWLQWRNRVLVDGAGHVVEYQGVGRDLTEQKRAEEELARYQEHLEQLVAQRTNELSQAKERVEAILHNSTEAILLVQPDLTIQQANRAFAALFACAPRTALGSSLTNFVDAVEHSKVSALIDAVLADGKGRSLEIRASRQDGVCFEAELGAGYIGRVNNQSLGLVCTLRDISERKAREADLRQTIAKEQELSELKSRFVSMASHEFRTPLGSILALTETLSAYRQRLTEEQITQRLDRIREQVGHLKAIMEDVLQLSRLQTKRVEFTPILFDLDELCRTVIDELTQQSSVPHPLVYTCTTPGRKVYLDKKLMRQVVNNLVSNALKYTLADQLIQVHLSYSEDRLVLTVQDTGIGIPATDLVHLFEPFHRAANVEAISGTGLGLTITKEAIELHGGTITVESQVGVGTTFVATLPILQ